MTCQMKNARHVAHFLEKHPMVEKLYYLGGIDPATAQGRIYQRQCLGAGSIISFDICGGEAEAFRFLDSLKLVKLAVSLGGTESLAEHPGTMTHADVEPAERVRMGITEKMVRLSIGVENPQDLIADLEQALNAARRPVAV
jgi:methionine-gamma-lyase